MTTLLNQTPPTTRVDHNRDCVFIKGLQIKTLIGVYEWERSIRQTISLDLEMATDVWSVAIDDRIDNSKAVDYAAVVKRLEALISAAECHLIETLAERVAECVLSEFGVSWIKVTLTKLGALSAAKEVGVVIVRSAD